MTLTFIPPDPSLADLFYEYRQDPITKKYNPLAQSSLSDLKDRLFKASGDLSQYETKESFFWFVKYEDKIVGIVTLSNISKTMLTGEISYGIFPAARAKGPGTSAVRLLTKNIFSQTPLRKLIAFVHEENTSSKKLREKIGYRQEGFLREHYLVNELPTNEVLFGILRKEFVY